MAPRARRPESDYKPWQTVSLPGALVRRIDEFCDRTGLYKSRGDFTAHAVRRLLEWEERREKDARFYGSE